MHESGEFLEEDKGNMKILKSFDNEELAKDENEEQMGSCKTL